MIAKAKAISHGKEAINYVLREGKLGNLLESNLIESYKPDDILKEFEMIQQYNSRCKNKFLRFEIGIAPQDEQKLKTNDLKAICRQFAKSMGLNNSQWFACTHKDTDNLHIHLIANRIDLDGKVYQTDFISNKASKTAEELSRKLGLTIANDVWKEKAYQKPHISTERLEIKNQLQDIAYSELRNKNNKTVKDFLTAIRKQGVQVEPVKNKQDKIYGIRFTFNEETFKASEIGKEFGFRSLLNHYGQTPEGQSSTPKHFSKLQFNAESTFTVQDAGSLVSGLFSAFSPSANPTSNEDEVPLWVDAMRRKKKKKRRRGIQN